MREAVYGLRKAFVVALSLFCPVSPQLGHIDSHTRCMVASWMLGDGAFVLGCAVVVCWNLLRPVLLSIARRLMTTARITNAELL